MLYFVKTKFILSQYGICLISTTFFVCNSWKKRVSVISHHAVCKFPTPSVIGQHQHRLVESRAEKHIITRHFPRGEYIIFNLFTLKMEDFVQGITPNMASTQVCDVCFCNIGNVAHDIISYTNETNVFTMDIGSRSSLLIIDMVVDLDVGLFMYL